MSDRAEAWFRRAEAVIPGGVNSPARAFGAVGGQWPPVMTRGAGAYLIDVGGRAYVDYLAAFGPLVLGHAHPRVVSAVQAQMAKGPLLGTPSDVEILLAEELTRSIPGLEMVRLTTTGTEAVMSVIRLARAVTGRSLLVKFEGTYHGHSDSVLVKAGSGAATIGHGDSLGVPEGVRGDVVTLPYNDSQSLRDLLARRGDEVALVLTEPVVGNMGIVAPEPGYLAEVARLTRHAGALLAFDEVITAYRFGYGAIGPTLGVVPDLYALGKIIGGGLAQGAYGGRRELMEWVAPLGGMFQAGTLAGNPLSAAAGLATLAVLREEDPYPRMDRLSRDLAEGIRKTADRLGVALTINRVGSAFTVFFGPDPVSDYAGADRASAATFSAFHRAMLERSVYLAPSRFEAWFVSAAHGEAEIERTLWAVEEAMKLIAPA